MNAMNHSLDSIMHNDKMWGMYRKCMKRVEKILSYMEKRMNQHIQECEQIQQVQGKSPFSTGKSSVNGWSERGKFWRRNLALSLGKQQIWLKLAASIATCGKLDTVILAWSTVICGLNVINSVSPYPYASRMPLWSAGDAWLIKTRLPFQTWMVQPDVHHHLLKVNEHHMQHDPSPIQLLLENHNPPSLVTRLFFCGVLLLPWCCSSRWCYENDAILRWFLLTPSKSIWLWLQKFGGPKKKMMAR